METKGEGKGAQGPVVNDDVSREAATGSESLPLLSSQRYRNYLLANAEFRQQDLRQQNATRSQSESNDQNARLGDLQAGQSVASQIEVSTMSDSNMSDSKKAEVASELDLSNERGEASADEGGSDSDLKVTTVATTIGSEEAMTSAHWLQRHSSTGLGAVMALLLVVFVGIPAYTHFDLDSEWNALLTRNQSPLGYGDIEAVKKAHHQGMNQVDKKKKIAAAAGGVIAAHESTITPAATAGLRQPRLVPAGIEARDGRADANKAQKEAPKPAVIPQSKSEKTRLQVAALAQQRELLKKAKRAEDAPAVIPTKTSEAIVPVVPVAEKIAVEPKKQAEPQEQKPQKVAEEPQAVVVNDKQPVVEKEVAPVEEVTAEPEVIQEEAAPELRIVPSVARGWYVRVAAATQADESGMIDKQKALIAVASPEKAYRLSIKGKSYTRLVVGPFKSKSAAGKELKRLKGVVPGDAFVSKLP